MGPNLRASAGNLPAPNLSRAALAFRAFHAAIAVEMLLAIGYVWWCALTGRTGGRLVGIAVATLLSEGVLVTANGGDCPLGGLQERLGGPVPLFEQVLSPPAAKRAVPTLGAIAAAGIAVLVAGRATRGGDYSSSAKLGPHEGLRFRQRRCTRG